MRTASNAMVQKWATLSAITVPACAGDASGARWGTPDTTRWAGRPPSVDHKVAQSTGGIAPEATLFAERLRHSVRTERRAVQGREAILRVSIGVATWPKHGPKFSDVLKAANAAERTAKDQGGDRVVAAP